MLWWLGNIAQAKGVVWEINGVIMSFVAIFFSCRYAILSDFHYFVFCRTCRPLDPLTTILICMSPMVSLLEVKSPAGFCAA